MEQRSARPSFASLFDFMDSESYLVPNRTRRVRAVRTERSKRSWIWLGAVRRSNNFPFSVARKRWAHLSFSLRPSSPLDGCCFSILVVLVAAPMTTHGVCDSIRDARERLARRIHRFIPCLADPGRRASVGLKAALVAIHLVFVGVLFLFDGDLINATRSSPWYTAIYLLLFVVTLVQYFYTSCSSPGYVLEAMRAMEEIQIKTSKNFRQSASSKAGSQSHPVDSRQSGWNYSELNATAWMKLVMDMYPPGSQSRNWTCAYCNLLQPPRAKHCHDCDKCVLQFDHHCVWLGTCIGQGNHCRFWWYILEETILCIWTGVLYISYLRTNITAEWWKDVIMILLLAVLSISLIFLLLLLFFHSYLVLTNQTTYELVRRRRIPYLRGIPDRVYPFSEGICRNLFNFCCSCSKGYILEAVPTAEEIEAQARPYTCWDVMACRCC